MLQLVAILIFLMEGSGLDCTLIYQSFIQMYQASGNFQEKRCIVNVGGVYFQILLLIPFLVIYLYSQSSLLSYIILIMNFNFLLTLNPFFKFDGYWIMTDVLGVANLRQKGKEWMLYMINKFRHKNTNKVPYLMSLSKGTKIALVIYTIVVNFFFGFYFLYILPLFLLDSIILFLKELNYY